MRFYRENPELRETARRFLGKLGKQSVGDSTRALFVDFPDFGLGKYRPLIVLWIGFTLASFVSPAFWGANAFLFIIPIGVVNFFT